MSVLVETHNEQEEKLLIAFLNSHKYDYKEDVLPEEKADFEAFIDEYNKEIDDADADIDAGNYIEHADVEKLFAERRKK